MDDPPIRVVGLRRLAGTEVTHPAVPSAMAVPSGLGNAYRERAPIAPVGAASFSSAETVWLLLNGLRPLALRWLSISSGVTGVGYGLGEQLGWQCCVIGHSPR